MKISIRSSLTLKRFSEGILEQGLEQLGCKVWHQHHPDARFTIVQIHGAPTAHEADLALISELPSIVASSQVCLILLHRPDEIRDTLPELAPCLARLETSRVALVMLGDLLIDDPYYQIPNLERCVIPHGFFNVPAQPIRPFVVIGSHTTWGEMRSPVRVLGLIQALQDLEVDLPVVGYLGGTPAELVSKEGLVTALKQCNATRDSTVQTLDAASWEAWKANPSSHTIFVRQGEALPDFDPTFNVQLYHYGQSVRRGESSGSLHASSGIPVVFEMNGAERIEGLRVIKVPYVESSCVESADYSSAARAIQHAINSGDYLAMMEHNTTARANWSNVAVARLYLDLFKKRGQIS